MDECHVHSGFSINLQSSTDTRRTSYDQFKGLMAKWNRVIMVSGMQRVSWPSGPVGSFGP